MGSLHALRSEGTRWTSVPWLVFVAILGDRRSLDAGLREGARGEAAVREMGGTRAERPRSARRSAWPRGRPHRHDSTPTAPKRRAQPAGRTSPAPLGHRGRPPRCADAAGASRQGRGAAAARSQRVRSPDPEGAPPRPLQPADRRCAATRQGRQPPRRRCTCSTERRTDEKQTANTAAANARAAEAQSPPLTRRPRRAYGMMACAGRRKTPR